MTKKQHCTTPDYALASMLKHGNGVNVKTLPGCIMRDFTVAVRTVEVVAVRTVAEVVDTVAEAVDTPPPPPPPLHPPHLIIIE